MRPTVDVVKRPQETLGGCVGDWQQGSCCVNNTSISLSARCLGTGNIAISPFSHSKLLINKIVRYLIVAMRIEAFMVTQRMTYRRLAPVSCQLFIVGGWLAARSPRLTGKTSLGVRLGGHCPRPSLGSMHGYISGRVHWKGRHSLTSTSPRTAIMRAQVSDPARVANCMDMGQRATKKSVTERHTSVIYTI